jgi:CCDC93, coiled-coil domain
MAKVDVSYQRRSTLDMDQTSEAEIIYRRKKLEEIVEVLLNAGYHRAMSKSLSEFDKVVGGLCWCITSIGIDVDVDILFQENLIIGQRIALSEAIITALRIMGCPSPLQAHQIQGMIIAVSIRLIIEARFVSIVVLVITSLQQSF